MSGGSVLRTDPMRNHPDSGPCGIMGGCQRAPQIEKVNYGHQIQNLIFVDSPFKNNLPLIDRCSIPGAECAYLARPIDLQNLMIVDSSKQPRHSRNPQPHPVPKSDNY